MLARASICSVTRIVPSSAAIALPTRPASIVAASTGPSSRTKRHVDDRTQSRFQPQLAKLKIALHGQHHADKRPGQGDDRQAQYAHLVEIRPQCLPLRQRVNIQTKVPQAKMLNRPTAITDWYTTRPQSTIHNVKRLN